MGASLVVDVKGAPRGPPSRRHHGGRIGDQVDQNAF
jgi:hypothetical protein